MKSKINQEFINKSFYYIFLEFLKNKTDFTLAVFNNNDWDKELPENLKKAETFLLNIDGDTLNNVELIKDEGEEVAVITTEFGDEIFSKIFNHHDIAGFMLHGTNQPYLLKPFKTKKSIKIPKNVEYKLSETDLENTNIVRSMTTFARYNPKLFKRGYLWQV